jgi:hypothetical protein
VPVPVSVPVPLPVPAPVVSNGFVAWQVFHCFHCLHCQNISIPIPYTPLLCLTFSPQDPLRPSSLYINTHTSTNQPLAFPFAQLTITPTSVAKMPPQPGGKRKRDRAVLEDPDVQDDSERLPCVQCFKHAIDEIWTAIESQQDEANLRESLPVIKCSFPFHG